MGPRSLCLALLLSTCTFAQSQTHADDPAMNPRVELFGSFSVAHSNPLGTNKGFKLGADFRLHGPFYLVAEQSHFFDLPQTYPGGSKSRDTSVLAGPRYRFARGRYAYFGDFLVGGNFYRNYNAVTPIYANANEPAFATGGGVDFTLTRHFAVRGEAEYFLSRLTNYSNGTLPFPPKFNLDRSRFSVDFVYRF
jgi:hypothetical protein